MGSLREQLQAGEEILYVGHPTRIVLYTVLFLSVTTLIATIAAYQSLGGEVMTLVIGGIILLPLLLILLQKWITIASNVWVVTNRRVIQQTGLVSKRSVTSYLDKINNVEHRQSLWGRILGYGDVEIDTASETGTTIFPQVADPIRFKNAILEASEQRRMRGGAGTPVVTESGSDRLRQLKALLDDGLVTAEEYEVKRKKLLEEM